MRTVAVAITVSDIRWIVPITDAGRIEDVGGTALKLDVLGVDPGVDDIRARSRTSRVVVDIVSVAAIAATTIVPSSVRDA